MEIIIHNKKEYDLKDAGYGTAKTLRLNVKIEIFNYEEDKFYEMIKQIQANWEVLEELTNMN